MRFRRREVNLTLQPGPRAARAARTAVEDTLASARPEVREDVQLLVSELVTNSVRHANLGPGDAVNVHVSASRRAVRVEVEDAGRGFDPDAVAGPRGTGGYGLFLVDRLANRWGVDTRDGASVWFELDRPFATN
jgi:anti-sigma regulatory factor (Ser/Thr protein kinase)